jgi:hypothetical protein
MVLDTFEKVTAELETAFFSMEKSYVRGFCKDDVYYDDFGQPWVGYNDMHDYSDMHEYAYTSYAYAYNELFEDKLSVENHETKGVSAAGDVFAAGDVDAASSKLIDIEESQLWILKNGVPKMDYRASDRRENKMHVHTWCNHVGKCLGYKICIQTKGAVKKVEASMNHVCDQVAGRSQYADHAATISHKSRRGYKYALGFTDDCTGWSPDYEEQFMETRDQTIATIIAVVNMVRTDPGLNCPDYCTRIVLDPAGRLSPPHEQPLVY